MGTPGSVIVGGVMTAGERKDHGEKKRKEEKRK